MESPPKRVTRARAAAKGKAPEKEKDTTIKVTTAAAKARASRVTKKELAPPLAAAPITRRRTRAATEEEEEKNNEEPQIEEMPEPKAPRTTRGRATRGKQTKVDEPEEDIKMDDVQEEQEAAPVANTRAKRVAKKAAEPAPTKPAAAPRAATTTRRTRKVETPTEEPLQSAAEPPKRTVRGRKAEAPVEEPAPEAPKRGLRRTATVTKPPIPAAPEKSVKFEVEPDKENDIPPVVARGTRRTAAPAKEPESTTGLRAKPVRKPAATRTTRGATAPSKPTEPAQLQKSPLSPKKATQVATAKPDEKDDSDDELAVMEKTPMRLLAQSPLKPPASLMSAAKKLDFTTSGAPNITVNRVITENPQLGASLLASPARKIPQSPWKGAIKDSPIKPPTFGESLLKSPKKLGEGFINSPFKSSMAPPSQSGTNAFKQSLLQSPARRPPSPVKVSAAGSPTRSPTRSTFGFGSTSKPSTFSISRFATPKTLAKNAFRPEKLPMSSQKPQTEAKPLQEAEVMNFADVKAFSGRLSSVLPRYADPVLREDAGLSPMGKAASADTHVETEIEPSVAEGQIESQDIEMPDSPQIEELLQEDEPAENIVQPRLSMVAETSESTTPTNTPPSFHTLRPEEDLENSDSEDELATGSPVYTVKMSSNDFKQLNSSPVKKLDFGGLKTAAIGFTPLSKQLTNWHAPSSRPEAEVDAEVEMELDAMEAENANAGLPRMDSMNSIGAESNESVALIDTFDSPKPAIQPQVVPSPAPSTSALPVASFFDDEMMMRDEDNAETALDHMGGDEILHEIDGLDALEMAPEEDEMDLAFAAEADELSMIQEENGLDDEEMDELVYQADQNEDLIHQDAVMDGMEIAEDPADAAFNNFNASMESALSEASQEYGDENAAPGESHLEPVLEKPGTPAAMMPLGETPKSRIPTSASTRRQSMPRVTPIAQSVRRSSRPFTPSRAVIEQRTVHTVSKVPLKPAAAESPIKFSPKKRPATVARLPAPRQAAGAVGTPSGLRNVRSVSSPTITTPTPAKGSLAAGNYAESEWSNLATPAKTPRPQGYGKILCGATVFVDVHTSEGADASAVFIDLLTEMGAKCLKQWNWNPSTSPISSANSSLNSNDGLDMNAELSAPSAADKKNIGITHVVFKDGSKRTMEKVRDSKGVVTCVGVGWVLDCEREAKWLDEAEYKVDTAFVPRGGARRRKSMEPRALANLNGTLVSTPGASNGKDTHKYPATEKPKKIGRRESTQWIRTPQAQQSKSMLDEDETPKQRYSIGGSVIDRDGDVDMFDYTLAELSPLPATPSTAQIQQFSEHALDGVEQTPFPPTAKKVDDAKAKLLMTAPAKRPEKPALGEIQGRKEGQAGGADSQALMMRLLAARRKSLQWAPKVGSPLSRMN